MLTDAGWDDGVTTMTLGEKSVLTISRYVLGPPYQMTLAYPGLQASTTLPLTPPFS